MSRDIFISYSRRDQEFVTRLASDLHAQVAGVWFDQSAIQVGQKWHDEIMDGIHECKAFILVLSPDAAESKYVREEVNKALELGKTIFPALYRAGKWTGEIEALVNEIQTLDLRSGSYTDNFYKLVDGLVEAGAAKATAERPFLRQATQIPLKVVFSKVPSWAFAWSLGWFIFWALTILFFFIPTAVRGELDGTFFRDLFTTFVSGVIGGFGGGLMAGALTMLALRPNAPSISWKHISPAIRIWAINGPLGMVISALIGLFLALIGSLGYQASDPDCVAGPGRCSAQFFGVSMGEAIDFELLAVLLLFSIAIVIWFLTGIFAGWQAVRHIRRLEPGITKRQSQGVVLGWGCGTIVAVMVWLISIGIINFVFGLIS